MPGFPPKMLQLAKKLHDNTTCAIGADKGGQGSWFQVSTAFNRGNVNAPLSFTACLESIRSYIAAKTGERLGLT